MNLNKSSQAKSEFSHAIRMVRNHIAEEHFISKFILSVNNLHERLGEAIARFDVKCQIWRHASCPCFKAVGASPKLYSITHKSMWWVWEISEKRKISWLWPFRVTSYLKYIYVKIPNYYTPNLQDWTNLPRHTYYSSRNQVGVTWRQA